MKSTGMIRRVDELGRLVIPKEIRRMLRIRDGEPLEIIVDKDETITLRKFSPVSTLAGLARVLVDTIDDITGKTVFIADRDGVVAAVGENRIINKIDIPSLIERVLAERSPMFIHEPQWPQGIAVCPIVSDGECIGVVALVEPSSQMQLTDSEQLLLKLSAGILGRHSTC